MTKQSKLSIFSTRWPFVALVAISLIVVYRYISSPDKISGSTQDTAHQSRGQGQKDSGLDERFSMGDKELFVQKNTQDRLIGIVLFAKGKFDNAAERFEASLKINPNDPEVLIYLNNSQAMSKSDEFLSPGILKIGVPIPISNNPNVANEILRGVAQAQKEINEERLKGKNRQIVIEIASDDNEPEIVTKIANIFSEDRNIMGVVGHNSSNASVTASKIYQREGLVMISPTSIANILSESGNYIFRTTPKSRDLAQTIAKYSKTINRSDVAVCFDSTNVASQSFKADFIDTIMRNGGKIISTNFDCDLSADNFDEIGFLQAAKNNGAKALLLSPSIDKLEKAMMVAKKSKNLTLLGHSSLYTYKTLELGQSGVNGMIIPTSWHSGDKSDDKFIRNAIKLWKHPGSWRTAMAYDATKAIAKASIKAKNRQEIQQNLADENFAVEGSFEEVTFQRSGDRQPGVISLIQIKPGKSTGTNFEFAPLETNMSR